LGQPQNNKGKKQGQQNEQQSSQPRDQRKELSERNKQKSDSENDPKSGEKSPEDPANQMRKKGSKSDNPNAQPPNDDDTPAWFAALPPEIRDAIDAGRGEEIPAKYQELVRRYNLWLQKQRRSGGR